MNHIFTIKSKPQKGKRDYRPRRVWSLQQKHEILALARETSTLHAARTHDVDIRLLFQWRAHERIGELAQRTWKDPGRPKRRNRQREALEIVEVTEFSGEDY